MPTSSHVFTTATCRWRRGSTVHRRPVRAPAGVVVLGSWLTVKEQMADHYAAALAARGYTAMTFDFAGFGASGGRLRQAELPARKVANLAAAAGWFASLSTVRPGGPGVVAVCASAQYALAAIAAGAPIGSFASVAGWFHDARSVAAFYGGADGVATGSSAARRPPTPSCGATPRRRRRRTRPATTGPACSSRWTTTATRPAAPFPPGATR